MGGLAVDLFFFLSGLFVSQSYLSDPNVIRFVAKRFLRIFPGLFICLLTTSVLAVLVDDPEHAISHFLSSSIYIYIADNARLYLNWSINGIFKHHTYQAINGSIHTLPLEWKMYMIMAVASLLGFLGNHRLVAGTALVLLVAALLPPSLTVGANFIFDADYSRSAGAMFFLGMVAFAGAKFVYMPWWCAALLSFATISTHGVAHVVLFYLSAIGWTLYLGEARWLARLAHPKTDLSYGVYIYGWPMQQIVLDIFGRDLSPYPLSLIALPMAILCALGSWTFVERPSISVGHRLKFASGRTQSRLIWALPVLVVVASFVVNLSVLRLW